MTRQEFLKKFVAGTGMKVKQPRQLGEKSSTDSMSTPNKVQGSKKIKTKSGCLQCGRNSY